LIKLENISKSFNKLGVLYAFSCTIAKGEFICFYGPSGIGKTTLLNILAGLSHPDSGKLENMAKKIGYVFQEPRLIPWCSVFDNIELVLFGISSDSKEKRAELIRTLLQKVDLDHFAQYYPSQLSGGMKQRVSLARAFAVQPDLLLLDEPFSSLDFKLKDTLCAYLLDLLSWKPCTTVFITHDLDDAIRMADRIFFLKDRPCQIKYEYILKVPQRQRNERFVFTQKTQIQSQLSQYYFT